MNEMLIRAMPVRNIHLTVPTTTAGVTTNKYLNYSASSAKLTFDSSSVLLTNEGILCSYLYTNIPHVLDILKVSDDFGEKMMAARLDLLSATGCDFVAVEAPLQAEIQRLGAIATLHSPFEGTAFQRIARPLGYARNVSPWVLKGSVICPKLGKKVAISLIFMPGLKDGSWSFSIRCSRWHFELMERLSFWLANVSNAMRDDGYEIVPFIFD